MKWNHLSLLAALAVACSAVASERGGPARTPLGAGQFSPPTIESYPSYPALNGVPASVRGQEYAPALPGDAASPHGDSQAAPQKGEGQPACMNCGHRQYQCCRQEASCCDGVWDDYCAEKQDWCERSGRRGMCNSLFGCREGDCNSHGHCTLFGGRNSSCGCNNGMARNGMLGGNRGARGSAKCSCGAVGTQRHDRGCASANCASPHCATAPQPPASPVGVGDPTAADEYPQAPAAPQIDPEPPIINLDSGPLTPDEASSSRRPLFRSSMQLEPKTSGGNVLRWKKR